MPKTLFSWRSFLYLLYALVLTVTLLYVRFPKEEFRSFCEYRFEQFLGDTQCRISKINYIFPLTVVFEDVKIGNPGAGQDRVQMDRLQLSPRLSSLFTSWTIVGELYSGTLEAIVTVPSDDDFFYVKEIYGKGLDVAKVLSGLPSLEREITGVLTFTGEYKTEFRHPLAGFGSGRVRIENGILHLQHTVLTVDAVEFQLIRIDGEYGDNALHLLDGNMEGKQFDAEFTGILQSPFPVTDGRLDIIGSLAPRKKFLRETPKVRKLLRRLRQNTGESTVSFKLGGTLYKPTFRYPR